MAKKSKQSPGVVARLEKFNPDNSETDMQSLPAVITAESRTAGMAALFASADAVRAVRKAERRNMPSMVKPGDVPIGQAICGIIVKNVASPVSTIQGRLLWLRQESGREITFPVTGVIRQALAPGVTGDAELKRALDAETGNLFMAVRTEDKISSKFKKTMFCFDVFTQTPTGTVVDKGERKP